MNMVKLENKYVYICHLWDFSKWLYCTDNFIQNKYYLEQKNEFMNDKCNYCENIMSRPTSRQTQEFQLQQKEIELPKFYTFTRLLEISCCLSFLGCVFLLISFCSPYWLASWQDTRSPFVNLGLWTVCFHLFRHPKVQFDLLFHGCYPVWGDSIKMIAYWMVPGWMISIQVMTTLAMVLSLSTQILSVCLLLRHPLHVILRFEKRFLSAAIFLNSSCATLMTVSVLVFPVYCWNRDYLLYPNYNYLSWSYAAAVVSILFFGSAASAMLQEMPHAKDREEKNLSLFYKLNPHLDPHRAMFLDKYSVTGSFLWKTMNNSHSTVQSFNVTLRNI